jgi:hypothetical protein
MATFGSRQSGFFSGGSSGGGGGGVPYTGATQDLDLGEFGLDAGFVQLDTTPTYSTSAIGKFVWNSTDGTANLGLMGGNVTLQLGQEEVVRVVNKSGGNLTEAGYQAVRVLGAQGQRLSVALAQGDNDANSQDTLGLVTENILNNQEGFVTASGLVRGIDTTGNLQGETWAEGDPLYLSPTTAGRITNVLPTAPQHTVRMGYVIVSNANNGSIFVKVDNGYELGELHNCYLPSPSNKDTIAWNSSTLRYENNNVATLLGQATSSANGYLASTDWTRFANFQILSGYQTLGSTFKSILMSNPSINNITQSLTLATGQLRGIAVYVPIAQTITGVKWFQSTQGNFTSSGFNGIALFTYSAGSLTRVAITPDAESTWETATINTWGNVAFTTPYSASEGLYFVCVLFNGGATAPAIYGTVNSVNANVNIGDFTNSAELSFNLGSQTTMPSSISMSAVTVSANNPAVYLY